MHAKGKERTRTVPTARPPFFGYSSFNPWPPTQTDRTHHHFSPRGWLPHLAGPQPLGELQRLATRFFGPVPGRALPAASSEYDSLPPPFLPEPDEPRLTYMVPVNDAREVKLTWCLPVPAGKLEEWIESKPEDVWSGLLRHRSPGGLLPYLKKKGWKKEVLRPQNSMVFGIYMYGGGFQASHRYQEFVRSIGRTWFWRIGGGSISNLLEVR